MARNSHLGGAIPSSSDPSTPYALERVGGEVAMSERDDEKPMWRQTLRFALPRVAMGAAVLGIVGFGLHFVPEADAKRGADNAIAKKGVLNAFAIAVGDCFQKPATQAEIESVAAVPCAQPHTAQVVSSYTYANPSEAVVPAQDQMMSDAMPVCTRAIAAATDIAELPAGVRVDVFVPNEGAWLAGDNDVLCVVVGSSPWTGSAMRNSS